MKKLLLLALSVAAIVSCNRQVEVNDPQPGNGELEAGQLIQLSSGSGATATMATPNQGVRAKFIVDDQIGLFATYGRLATAEQPESNAPDWAVGDSVAQTGQYFTNWAAQCKLVRPEDPGTPADTTDKFAWGAKGQGGVGIDRIYPRAQHGIFVYAYYPYSASTDSVSIDPTAGPQVKIKLMDLNTVPGAEGAEPTFVGIKDAEHLQADVLFAQGKSVGKLDSVKRSDPLAPLYFKHALAQLNFKVARDAGATDCQLIKIVLRVPRSGVMNVMDGTVKINIPADPAASDSIIYTITDKYETPIDEGKEKAIVVLKNNPLMILPMTPAEAKTCRLQLTVYFGTETAEDDVANHRTFNVNLDFATMKGFLQGKKNTITMLTSETGVKLEATIAPWGEDGEEVEVPVE